MSIFRTIFARIWPIGLLLLLVALFFNKLAFSNLILARGDTFLYFYPYWEAASAALQLGRVPLWNDAIFMGAPLLANSQMGFFYPLNWPVWLLLPVAYAASASILLHLVIAGMGTYFVARRVMVVGRWAAMASAVLFALGGYLTAQVEHINQVQGLAWLPWLLLVVAFVPADEAAANGWRTALKKTAGVALLFALQLAAGHTQSTFISGVGVGLWLLTDTLEHWRDESPKGHVGRFVPLALGALFALLIVAVQLLPTAELTSLSSRQSGLTRNEMLSFSLNPLLLTQALLPALNQSLFTEYVAVLPLTALALAFIGAWHRRRAGVIPAVVWVVVGLLLALGIFNPANWLLADVAGFNLFRVPARWLILYALGVALLAGVGWDGVSAVVRSKRTPQSAKRPLKIALIVLVLLMAWGFVAPLLTRFVPVGAEALVEPPGTQTMLLWLVEVGVLLFLNWLLRDSTRRSQTNQFFLRPASLLLILGVLFVATRTHPYNHPTTPEAYFDLRPPIARLQAQARGSVPGRVLGLSDIFFDPGDQAEIDTIYADQLSAEALYDYTIAIKHKEVVSPNLPQSFGLQSVDGFDGGILPLQSYSELMALLLPDGQTTTDGRLREHLDAVPEARWLDLFNAQFLITDKVGDVWREGVFFDQQHPVALTAGTSVAVGYLPEYEATELWLIASDLPLGAAIDGERVSAEALGDGLYRVLFPAPVSAETIDLFGCATRCEIRAITLVDSRDGTFQPLVAGAYRLIHSGDVKIYENLDLLPRAFVARGVVVVADSAEALALLGQGTTPPDLALVVAPSEAVDLPLEGPEVASAEVVAYAPEQVVVQVETDAPAVLVLTDANYPGWGVTVDGVSAELLNVDGLFRGVRVPAGRHEIVFSFVSASYQTGLLISLVALVGFGLLLLLAWWPVRVSAEAES